MQQSQKSQQPLDEKSLQSLQISIEGVTNVDLQKALFNLGIGIIEASSSLEEKKVPEMTEPPTPVRPPDVYPWDGSKI